MLSTLTTRELRRFEEFIISPFFNKNETPVQLFQVLKKYHPHYEEHKTSMEAIFPKLFPKEKFEEQRLRYLMTDLTKLLEEFLSYTEYDKQEINKKYLLMSALDNRNLDKHFTATYENARLVQDKEPYRDVNYYFNRYLLEEKAYQHIHAKEQDALETSIQQAVDNLDVYYLSNKLRYCSALLTRQNILREDFHNPLLNEILQYLEKNNYDHVPSVAIYYLILKTLNDRDNLDNYSKLKELLEKNLEKFAISELQDMYTSLMNFCIYKINTGDSSFLKELFEQYKFIIEKGIIFENGYISPHEFKNIVIVGLRVNEVDYIEKFLHDNKEHLHPEFQDSIYTYNLAFVHFYKKDFSKALRLLQTADFKDVFYHLDARTLLLRTYYELDETEPFFSMIDSFNNYLKRNKLISESQRTSYLNFVKYVKKLMQIRLGSKMTAAELKAEIEDVKHVGNQQWLLQKIEEHEKAAH